MTGRKPDGYPVPGRLVERVLVKRNNPTMLDVYGHWWVEVDGDESYGWWPAVRPVGLRRGLRGVAGVLNGVGATDGGSPRRDPHHGELADHIFHPAALDDRSDGRIVDAVRAFAAAFRGEWRWSTRPTVNCRSFQLDLLAAAGLAEPPGYLHTRGLGCPFLAPIRRARTSTRAETASSHDPSVGAGAGRLVGDVDLRAGTKGDAVETHRLHELVDDLVGPPRDHRGDDARLEVVPQHDAVRPLERALDRR